MHDFTDSTILYIPADNLQREVKKEQLLFSRALTIRGCGWIKKKPERTFQLRNGKVIFGRCGAFWNNQRMLRVSKIIKAYHL
jgi:hypothetical protein